MDFHDSIITLGFSDSLNQMLLRLYLDNLEDVRAISGDLSMKLPSYVDLQYRIDIQVASRALKQQAEPSLLLKLGVTDANAREFPSPLPSPAQCSDSRID